MNTQNSNQQLYGEPLFVEGTAGKKQVYGEPQFVTGEEKHAHRLTPLYADNDITTHRTDPHHSEHKNEHHHDSSKAPEHVHLTIHTDDPSKINLEELIHITPEGQIKVVKDEEEIRHLRRQEPLRHEEKDYHTEHHRPEYSHDEYYSEHRPEHHHPEQHHPEHYHPEHRRTEHLPEPSHYGEKHYHPEHVKKLLHDDTHYQAEHGTLQSKKASRRLSDRVQHTLPSETTTVVKVDEHVHEGTTRHPDDRKSDTHHGSVTKVKVDKARSAEYVPKDEHLKANKTSKMKRFSDKARHREESTVVKVTDKQHSESHVKGGHGMDKQHSESHVKGGRGMDKQHSETQIKGDANGRHLVQQLRATLNDSDTPNMEIIGELLIKAESLLAKSASQTNVDPEARKALDDISTMLITVKQLERHKGIAERLQRISDECQQSLNTVKSSDTPSTVKNASREAVDFVKVWRPVFQLLIRSRDFRQLIVDSLRIVKRVVTRNKGIMDDLTQKFIDGDSARDLKQTAKDHKESSVNVKMTDREWEYLQEEVQSALAVLARNPQYHDAINRLFTLLDIFKSNMKSALPSSDSNRFELEIHARKAKMETEELVASFTGREILKEFKFRLRRLLQAYNKDPEIRRYFSELKDFILSSKSEEEVRSDVYRQRVRDLINRGRYLMEKSKQRDEVEQFVDTGAQLIENIKNDEYVKELRARAGIVRSDLTYVDHEGRTKIDVDMLVKLQGALMPVLADTFQKIHIPRIEHSDPRLDFWVDNIVLCGYDIFPDNIKFHIERETELSFRDVESKGSYTRLVVHLDKLRTEIRNIEFYFKRKTMPTLSDSGLVTFRIPENGAHLAIYFTLEERPGETHPRLTEGYAEFSIHKMDIEFDKSTLKHDVLLPMMIGLAKPAILAKIEKAVETNLSNALKQLGERLTTALGEVNRPSFLGGKFGSVKEHIKASDPAQVYQKRRVKLE